MAPAKRWLISPPITPEAHETLAAFPPVLRQLLLNRGQGTEAAARAFLAARPDCDTNPFQLGGMEAVVDRLQFARSHGQRVAIYGDYDVDGVTATALLAQTLERFGTVIRPYIPRRFDEGYGLNNAALDTLKREGVQVVITVDCGIRSPEEALHAKEIGLDLIISDHHHPIEGSVPQAFAVVSPKRYGDPYPDKNLAGVGIAYKIAEALQVGERSPLQLEELLDLVALGTVADLAPLVGENRALVRQGLRAIRSTRRQGLFSLANVADMTIGSTTSAQIGFILGPRLNAAGRLESAEAALELLTTSDPHRAGQLALQLNDQNRRRQELTRITQARAEELATADETDPILMFAADEEFNAGVVGLAASRLAETYYRPAIVAAKGPEETRGSCRSIPEFHITDALDQCADLLVRHGGHAAAAGFTVRNENLPGLIDRLKSLARAKLGSQELRPTLSADMEVNSSALSFDLLRQLAELEPTGYANPEATFVSRGVKVRSSRTVGAEGRHLKLTLEDERGAALDAIGFRLGPMQPTLGPRLDIAYTLEANEYNGRTTMQLNLRDVRPAGMQD